MSLRGELYYAGAWILGRQWRARLREIKTAPVGTIERRSLPPLLEHARTHVPFYRNRGISEPRLRSFPLLSRQSLRSDFAQLASDDIENRPHTRMSTGGSTGQPVWILHDPHFSAWDHAAEMYFLESLCGVSPHHYLRSRRVCIWHQRRRNPSRNPWKRFAAKLLGRTIYIEPYLALDGAQFREHLRRINRHRPAIIKTFAGTAFQLARYAKRKGIRVHRPEIIVSSVEMLYPSMRAVIEEVFGCPVRNMYGSAEVGRVAAECSAGKLHLLTFVNLVEVLNPDNTPTEPGSVGRLIVTPLHNHTMPLIRYDIGDLARVSSEPCTCGNPLPTIDELTGRVVHHFVRSDGSLVFGGNFVAMFYEHEWIAGFHILQEDIDRVAIQYQRTPGHQVPKTDIADLTQVVRNAMGTDCVVTWQEADTVPVSSIGKHLHVRSLVWEAQIESEGRV